MTEKLKDFLANFAAGAVIAALVCWLNASRGFPALHFLSDGFFVAGVMLFGFGVIKGIRNKGVFDVAGFGLKSTLELVFPFARREEKEDIHAYRARKEEERKSAIGSILAGLAYLLLSAVFLVLYLVVYKS